MQPLQGESASMAGIFVADEIARHHMLSRNMIVEQKGLD